MKKKRSLKSLKKQAWKLFSEYVRKRGMTIGGHNRCVSCKTVAHWKNLQAGHFVHGHSKLTFLDERNVHPQCARCNHYLSGNLIEYSEFMRKEYGQDTIDALRELSHQIWKPTRDELLQLIAKYKRVETK